MIESIFLVIFNTVLNFLVGIIRLILLPIDALIQAWIPDLSNGLTAIGDLIVIMTQTIGWAISAAGIPSSVVALIASYWIFVVTVPVSVWFIKLVLKWYKALRG